MISPSLSRPINPNVPTDPNMMVDNLDSKIKYDITTLQMKRTHQITKTNNSH